MGEIFNLEEFNGFLSEFKGKVFFLVDQNTHQNCLIPLLQNLPDLKEYEVLEIPSGEENKTLDISHQIWMAMLDLKAERNSLLVNVGGGVITDLGGFLATLFKRGMPFVHVPTSLLAMVDAAHGGKNGVDLEQVKNAIGTFSLPEMVVMESDFLETLPDVQFRSGFAEMLKHGLISSSRHWSHIIEEYPNFKSQTILDSASLKREIVTADFKENGERKKLNFGHTLGHAVESQFLSEGRPILHGEAVAIGMVCAAYLSCVKTNLSKSHFEEITKSVFQFFPKLDLPEIDPVLSWLAHDKKNQNGALKFVLLTEIGSAKIDIDVSLAEAREALEYYRTL